MYAPASQAKITRTTYPSAITRLFLHGNRLSVAAAFAIGDMLRSSDQLADLDVSNNPWGRLGARVIVSSILVNGGLKSISIEGDGIPTSLVAQAESALDCNLMEDATGAAAARQQRNKSLRTF